MAIIYCDVENASYYQVYIEYEIEQSTSEMKSVITHALKLKQVTDSMDFAGNMTITYSVASDTKTLNDYVDINDKGNAGYTITLASGTTEVLHDPANGRAVFVVSCEGSCKAGGYGPGDIALSHKTISLPPLPVLDLSILADENTSVTVYRTASSGGGVGYIGQGSNVLYYGDSLKITFNASSNFSVVNHTVNNQTFTSGNTYTALTDVNISASSSRNAAVVSATNADIESVSTIVIQPSQGGCTYSVSYESGSDSGVIAEGTTRTTIQWLVPDSLYATIPNDMVAKCTIICKEYYNGALIGTSTCEMNASVSKLDCAPSISASAVDINEDTIALTGNPATLVRYLSTAECTLHTTANAHATIKERCINGVVLEDGTSSLIVDRVESPTFTFSSEDSRGIRINGKTTANMIPYIPLTFNPSLSRPDHTGDKICVSFTGDYYGGSFGLCDNSLIISYRYKAGSNGTYTQWATIDSSSYTISDSSYSSGGSIEFPESFDYNQQYTFEFRAVDGSSEHPLSVLTRTVSVAKGIPVFDWGENDFNFNVPIMIGGINIFNLIYPIGAVYMHSSDEMPESISSIGAWSVIDSGIDGVFAWERTE